MRINEIFTSLSGECDGFGLQGGLATFVRLQGCNLDCKWCDTKYAQCINKGVVMSVEEVIAKCTTRHIIITGGEPLLQTGEVKELAIQLSEQFHFVTIETNGSLEITIDPARARYEWIRFVVDYKLDSSGIQNGVMLPSIFERLYALDVIKFVIADYQDYRQAKDILLRNPEWRAKKVFSPVPKGNWPAELANEIVQDRLENVQLSLQWHKIVNVK